MKKLKIISVLVLLAGCSSHDDAPVSESKVSPSVQVVSPKKKTEEFSILSDLFQDEIRTSNAALDLADQLNYKKYDIGEKISQSDCATISDSVLKNYSLQKEVSDLCPLLSDQNVLTAYSILSNVENSQGVSATQILTVETFNVSLSEKQIEQYLLDSMARIVEYSVSRGDSRLVSTITKNGDLISELRKKSQNSSGIAVWLSQSSFVSKDAKIASATRVRQNNDSGEPVAMTQIQIAGPDASRSEIFPVEYHTALFEKAPSFTTIQTTSSSATNACNYGIMGTREFGELRCQKKMNISTTLFED